MNKKYTSNDFVGRNNNYSYDNNNYNDNNNNNSNDNNNDNNNRTGRPLIVRHMEFQSKVHRDIDRLRVEKARYKTKL